MPTLPCASTTKSPLSDVPTPTKQLMLTQDAWYACPSPATADATLPVVPDTWAFHMSAVKGLLCRGTTRGRGVRTAHHRLDQPNAHGRRTWPGSMHCSWWCRHGATALNRSALLMKCRSMTTVAVLAKAQQLSLSIGSKGTELITLRYSMTCACEHAFVRRALAPAQAWRPTTTHLWSVQHTAGLAIG